ncbi:protein phosphatase 2C domain-containing protein [Candidatus Pacearchaeota archaeon]|nr:protein phosphatase 2C domain-containing protein [Candidatus Pacearchaeota archaeon]
MNSDSYFQIGHSHRICEDYALSGTTKDGGYYAVIADGCSQSKEHDPNAKTDIGARILAHCAVAVINEVFGYVMPSTKHTHRIIGGLTINRAQRTIKDLGLPQSSLDATLIITVALLHGEPLVLFYGDGTVVFEKDGIETQYDVSYPSGAPYYLSYLLDDKRREGYFAKFGDVYKIEKHGLTNKLTVEDTCEEFSIKEDEVLFQEEADTVTITSDGIETFEYLKASDEPLPAEIAEVTTFVSKRGEYVKRNMLWLASRNAKRGIVHQDDFSMASISLN